MFDLDEPMVSAPNEKSRGTIVAVHQLTTMLLRSRSAEGRPLDKELWVAFTEANSVMARDIVTHQVQWQADNSLALSNGSEQKNGVNEVARYVNEPSECPSGPRSISGD